MNTRRDFLTGGAALGVGTLSSAALADQGLNGAGADSTTLAQHICADLNSLFLKQPVRADAFERNGQNRIYITLTTKARDANQLPQKIGSSWYFDLQTHSWHQKKQWLSVGTEAQYASLIDKARERILTLVG